jgi:CheY-like chemotaxis protein
MSSLKPILYAEDDENDAFLMDRVFQKLKVPNRLQVVADGKLAIAYLAGSAPYQSRETYPLPVLLLLDLSLPGRHGLEVLKWIKGEPALTTLPVVVLSSSNQQSDVHRAFLLGAQGFIVKPGDPDELSRIVQVIQAYWLGEIRPTQPFVDFAAAARIGMARPSEIPV